jgi:hypothetical protein
MQPVGSGTSLSAVPGRVISEMNLDSIVVNITKTISVPSLLLFYNTTPRLQLLSCQTFSVLLPALPDLLG